MAEAVEEVINQTCSESNGQTERINSLIKELTELNGAIIEEKKLRDRYRFHISVVQNDIWSKKTKYRGLKIREAHLRSKISEAMKVIELNEEKLANLQARRLEEWTEKCNKFKIETAKYVDYFVRAQTEYSSENLMKDIEEYRIECNNINEELTPMKRRLENMEKKMGYNCLNTNEEFEGSEDLSKIDNLLTNIKLNDNNTLQELISIDNEVQNIQAEIKQKKMMLDGFK